MILHRLLIEDFRGVRREEVEVPGKGVLVIEGPNESGKTSLVEALEMLLEYKASSTRADVKAAGPVGRDVPVVVEAEFTVDGRRMRYRKEFLRGKRTTLEFPGSTTPALTGDDAHEHVRELLDSSVDRSLWRALRIQQDDPITQVRAADGMDSLRRALDAAAGGRDPAGDDSLVARVADERGRYLTAKKGEPTGDLLTSETRVAGAREALVAAEARYAELDDAVAEHTAEAASHEARVTSLGAIEAEVERLAAADRAVDDLRQADRAAGAELDRASVLHEVADRSLRERHELIARHDEAGRAAAEARDASEAAAARLAPAEARSREVREELDRAEEAVTRTRARHDAVRDARERARREADLTAVEELLETLRSVGRDVATREEEYESVRLDEAVPGRLRAADEAWREAVVRRAASAPRVEVAGAGELTAGGEPVDAADGWADQIVEDTVFEVGEVALTVIPAGDTDTVRREVLGARRDLEALLEEAGVDSVEEAEERVRRAAALESEVAALRRRRTDLLGGDTPEDLERRRDGLRDEVGKDREAGAGETATAPDSPPDSAPDEAGEAADEAARAAEHVAGVRASERTAAAEAEACRTEAATRSALAGEADRRVEEQRGALGRERASTPDGALAGQESRARDSLDTAREVAREAAERLREALSRTPPELLDNARASRDSLVAEERRSAAAVATALGRVNAIADQGRLDDVSVAGQELEAAERENAALWRRARAADLLHQTLTRRRAEAMRAYQEPFHRAVVELGSLVYGSEFDVELDEDLTIRSRRIGPVTVDYDSLSGGAREQLSVIVRIACARLVGEAGVPVFLDDTMGYTDPSRRLAMGAVIAAAGATSQLVVLTCDRARFAGIGGARSHVMGRTGAADD